MSSIAARFSTPSAFSTRMRLFAAVFAVLIGLTLVACESDEQKIRDANQAAAGDVERSSDELSSQISIFDLRTGDCYNEPQLSAIGDGQNVDLLRVELVPCTAVYDFKVARSFVVDGGDGARYPGVSHFDDLFITECPLASELFLYPTADSWAVGDRVFQCIEEG